MANRSVAIVGASRDRTKFGNKSVRAHAAKGWDVYPVNPHETEIEGYRCYPTLEAVPAKLDRVSLYLPPSIGVKVLPSIAAIRPTEFFVNPGAESEELLAEAERLGLDPILACSIVDLGTTPGAFDE